MRFCVDSRDLDTVAEKDVHFHPRMRDALGVLSNNAYSTMLDAVSGYRQLEMDRNDERKTVLCTPNGLFQSSRMPFGLVNAPTRFEGSAKQVIGSLKYRLSLVCLDDLIIHS